MKYLLIYNIIKLKFIDYIYGRQINEYYNS